MTTWAPTSPTSPAGLPCRLVYVVFLALSPARLAATVEDMDFVLARGGRVTLVAADPEVWGQLDHRIDTVGLSAAEQRYWLLRGERLVLYRIPDLPIRLLRRLLELGARQAATPVDRPLTRWVHALDVLRTRVRAIANRVHRGGFLPRYRAFRPWVLWRVARRELLPTRDFRGADQIIVADAFSIALGWHLARQLPDVKVGFRLDRRLTTEHAA